MMSKVYEITFVPVGGLILKYTVDADNEDDAYDEAKQELRFSVGYDQAKHDWECDNIVEVSDV